MGVFLLGLFVFFIFYLLEDKTLHLFDIVANNIPSLDLILDHLPSPIDQIYFYFSPDLLTNAAVSEPYLYDNGHLMIHGNFPSIKPFMISPLSRADSKKLNILTQIKICNIFIFY